MRKSTLPLVVTNPEIAKMWHPEKNGVVTPNDVGRNTKKKAWFRCIETGDPEHEWESYVFSQVKYPGCPFCSGQRVCSSNSLSALHPEVAVQ